MFRVGRWIRDVLGRLFGRRRTAVAEPSASRIEAPDRSVETDLLTDDDTLRALSRKASSLQINVNGRMNDIETRLFYRNLIRMDVAHRFPREKMTFVIDSADGRGAVIAEQLRRKGYGNIAVTAADAPREAEHRGDETLLEFYVAGLKYHVQPEEIALMSVGRQVTLHAEPDNPHDADAVAVIAGHRLIGYIPRQHNRDIAVLLRGGYGRSLRAAIIENNPDAPMHERLRVAVSILPRE